MRKVAVCSQQKGVWKGVLKAAVYSYLERGSERDLESRYLSRSERGPKRFLKVAVYSVLERCQERCLKRCGVFIPEKWSGKELLKSRFVSRVWKVL